MKEPRSGGAVDSVRMLVDPLDMRRPLRRSTRAEALDAAALGHHVTLRLEDDRTIAKTVADRRVAARVVLVRGALFQLLALFVSDTHIHVLLACARAAAGAFAQAVTASLRQRLRIPVPFEPAHIRRVHDQAHLGLAHRYIHRQASKHDLPAEIIADASTAADLCGLRVVDPGLRRRVIEHLPRSWLDPTETGLDRRAIEVAVPALDDLADAAAAALALVDLRGEDAARVAARVAAVHVGRTFGLRPSALSDRLQVSTRTVRRLTQVEPSPSLLRAVTLQTRLRGLEAEAAMLESARVLSARTEEGIQVARRDAGWVPVAPPHGARAAAGDAHQVVVDRGPRSTADDGRTPATSKGLPARREQVDPVERALAPEGTEARHLHPSRLLPVTPYSPHFPPDPFR